MTDLPTTKNCFACGADNAAGLRLQMKTDGKTVEAEFIPRPEHAGFTHAVHGGIITTALDEMMAWAIIASTRKPAYSAEFTVRFTRPVRIGEVTRLRAEVVVNRRNRLFETRGELRNAANEVCAVATGKYLPLNAEDAETALLDFPEPVRAYFRDSI